MNTQAEASPSRALSPDALSGMFQCIEGLKNLRAAAAMAICFVGAVLLVGLFVALFRSTGGMVALGVLLAIVLAFAGVHAAGALLMDQATGAPPRSIADAIVYGLWCVPKAIGLIVCLVLAMVVLYLLMALVLYVCKIPGVGPVLYTIAFPILIVVAGIAYIGMFIAFELALAAFWAGAGVVGALAEALAILRTRLVETVLLLLVVGVLAGLVGGVITFVLLTGLLPTLGLSAAILKTGLGSIGSLMGMAGMGGMGGMGGGMYGGGMYGGGMGGGAAHGAGYLLAGAIGGGVLWALALTLVSLVGLMGLNLVYLRVREGLDASAAEQAMRQGLGEARRKAAEMGQKAKEAGERARAQAEQALAARRAAQAAAATSAAAVTPAPSAAAAGCPQCGAAIVPDDVFCGSCGHKLK